jgi:hypothetical protein
MLANADPRFAQSLYSASSKTLLIPRVVVFENIVMSEERLGLTREDVALTNTAVIVHT